MVTASLFLHHFDAGELPGLLRELCALARRALVVTDLRRARVPYLFGRAVFPLALPLPRERQRRPRSRSGAPSAPSELRAAFAARRHARTSTIRRVFPYRLVAVAAFRTRREAA